MKPLSKLHTEAIEKAKTEQAKVKAAALAMIETPMDMIKSILLKHEEAVIEVMRELHQQQQADEALLKQALEALENNLQVMKADWEQIDQEWGPSQGGLQAAIDGTLTGYEYFKDTISAITAIRARLTGDSLAPVANHTEGS